MVYKHKTTERDSFPSKTVMIIAFTSKWEDAIVR